MPDSCIWQRYPYKLPNPAVGGIRRHRKAKTILVMRSERDYRDKCMHAECIKKGTNRVVLELKNIDIPGII